MMHEPKKSDFAKVATKPTNNAGRKTAAESAERRAGTKGNVDQQSTHRTQIRDRVSQALGRARQAAKDVTDAVLEEVGRWQSRPLDPLYALVFFDALRVKMRDEGTVRNKAVYLAIGVSPDGRKDVLGIWIEQTEGAKFWLRVMTEIKSRGVNDILIAVVDDLKGFPEAINAVFAETQIQTCIVHLIRNSLDFCSWKDRKPVAQELKTIYRAQDAQAAAAALQEFEDGP